MKTKKPTLHIFLPALFSLFVLAANNSRAEDKDWSFNATIIEACSCPMFCQCYFNAKPSSHAGHMGMASETYCRGNLVFKVNSGYYGNVKLDGIKFWNAGDLGDDLSDGEAEWGVLHFEPTATKEQRDAIVTILNYVYPIKWKSFNVGEDKDIEWTADKDRAVAKLDGGKAGEVILNRTPGNTDEPVVIKNLKYVGAPRNDGFVLMPNEVEAYRLGDKAFEFKGTNGFMITIDINSNDVKR